jgi:hypothetical protein
LSWILPRVAQTAVAAAPDRRTSLQSMLRAGLLAEPLDVSLFEDWDDDEEDDDDDEYDSDVPF